MCAFITKKRHFVTHPMLRCKCTVEDAHVHCERALLGEHFPYTYFPCRSLSNSSEEEEEEEEGGGECAHAWRKYGHKHGRGYVQREYYKCRLCALRKRMTFKVTRKGKFETDCKMAHTLKR